MPSLRPRRYTLGRRALAGQPASRRGGHKRANWVEYFALGRPGDRARFRGLASPLTLERFFRLIRRAVLSRLYEEQCREPFQGAVECDETMFGGYRPGKLGWDAAAGKVIVLGILRRNMDRPRVFPRSRGPKRGRDCRLGPGEHPRGRAVCTLSIRTTGMPARIAGPVRGDRILSSARKAAAAPPPLPKGRAHINGIEGDSRVIRNISSIHTVAALQVFPPLPG